MLKILILSKQMSTSKTIINNILSNIEDVRIIGIANTLTEAQELLINNQPDLVLTTDPKIINLIREQFVSFLPGIVFFTNRRVEIDINYKNLLILNQQQNSSFLINSIKKFIKNNVALSRKEKAANILAELGFDFKLNGTIYLLDSILYVHTYKGSCTFEQLKRDIYPYVAEMNSTSVDKVKWSVDRTLNYMYRRHDQKSYKIVEKYFKIKYPVKPTPKLIVSIIANTLDL